MIKPYNNNIISGDQIYYRIKDLFAQPFQVGTMEALNKHLTGDGTEFSEQYFVDCTFDYSGCAGGVVNEGYKLTKMRQYLVSAEDMPYTGDCKSTFQSSPLQYFFKYVPN